VREAAARAQCQNNLKQLSLAICNYHDLLNEFPSATAPQPSLRIEERLSWLALIFPFLEEETVARYGLSDWTMGWAAERNSFWTGASVRAFQCPGADIPQPRQDWLNTSYVGIAGVGADAASLPLGDAHCGVFGYERHVKMKDIKDGMGNTMAIIETMSENGRWAAGGHSTVRSLEPAQQPYIGEHRPFGIDHRKPVLGRFEFASPTVWANAALLDGSVRKLNASVSPQTIEALATIAGNESIPVDF
jgi:hypothetical protein